MQGSTCRHTRRGGLDARAPVGVGCNAPSLTGHPPFRGPRSHDLPSTGPQRSASIRPRTMEPLPHRRLRRDRPSPRAAAVASGALPALPPPPPASPPPPLPTVLFGRCAKAERSWPRLRAAHGPPPTPSSDPPRDQPPDGRRRTLGQPPSPPTRGGRPPLPPSPLPVREASAHRPAHAAATLPPTTRSRGGRSAAFTKKAAPLGGRWPSSGRAGGTPRKRPPPTRGAWSG